MATIEEQLVGFQVVRVLNQAQRGALDIAGKMQVASDDAEAAKLKARAAASIDISEKKLQMLSAFLDGYPGGPAALARAYQWAGVTPKQVTDELGNLRAVQATAKQAIEAAGPVKDEINNVGSQMHDSVEAHITEIMDEELHFEPIQMHVSAWDLVNVMAIRLQGVNQGNGEDMPDDTVEKRKAEIERHIKTFYRAVKYLDDSEEALNIIAAADIVRDSLGVCTTLDQLRSLGVLIDARVPRIPLVRRAWQYGQTVRNNPGP